MGKTLKLPVGIENFQEIRSLGFYYVDKTKLIEQLLDNWGKVNLFTRPRRFGKTLNMSMLKCFFEIGTDPTLFEGLSISKNQILCEQYLGKFPVIFVTLKSVEGQNFEEAKRMLANLIVREADRFRFLQNSDKLTAEEKEWYHKLISIRNSSYMMEIDTLASSFQVLSELLYKHYGQKTVLLIDEYDVPLDKAFQNGYYQEMVSMLRGVFGQALKTNDFLQFAVLTGCLRVSKESIFTGLNNFKILSITDTRFSEQFGFTEEELRKLFAAYHLENHFAQAKEWYYGYRFGNADIYCPWDVINYVDALRYDANTEPQAYWINTSGNGLVKRFIDKSDQTTRDELEELVSGGCIEKKIRQDLTYNEIDNSINNLWSVLLTTGYLTLVEKPRGDIFKLKIPNEEVRKFYEYQIQDWFSNTVLKNMDWLPTFWQAFEEGNVKEIETRLTGTLSKTISVYDLKKSEPENSYHTFLLGMLAGNAVWGIVSNREGGEGRADILIRTEDPDAGIVIELKRANSFRELDQKCHEAMEQIHDRHYDNYLRDDGRENIWAYGIAFYRKRCKVLAEKL